MDCIICIPVPSRGNNTCGFFSPRKILPIPVTNTFHLLLPGVETAVLRFMHKGDFHRFAQRCEPFYGKGLDLYQITDLSSRLCREELKHPRFPSGDAIAIFCNLRRKRSLPGIPLFSVLCSLNSDGSSFIIFRDSAISVHARTAWNQIFLFCARVWTEVIP